MRVSVIFVVVFFGFGLLAFAQEGFDRPRRQRRERPGFSQERRRLRVPRNITLAMEIDGNFAYVLVGTRLYKVNLQTMETTATCELAEEEEKESAKPKTAQDVIKKFDRDGDGRISREEWRGPGELFDRLDRNGDGAITPNEIPQKLVEIFKRRFSKPKLPPLNACIRFTKDFLIVLLGNSLYKIRKEDLLIVGQTKLKPEKRRTKKPDEQEQPTDKQKPKKATPAPKKEKDDDFRF